MSELPRQSPKLAVYREGLLLSSRYRVSPEFEVVSITWVSCAAELYGMSDRKERKRTRTPGHDASRKPNGGEVIVVEVSGRPTAASTLQADLVGSGSLWWDML